MNESKLQEIARLCAFCFGQDHDYTPNHADEEWQAHGWVIEAMKAALAAAPSPAPVPVDPAELAALRARIAELEQEAERERAMWNALVDYCIECDEPDTFMRNWREGEFDTCREEWPDSPPECYPDAALAANGEKS